MIDEIKSLEKTPFTGDEGEKIPAETAKKWMNNYEFAENIHGTSETLVKAHFFGKNKVNEILSTQGCVGIRIYYALNDKGHKSLLITAVDKDWNDIGGEDNNIIVLDMSRYCPPYCSK